MAEALAGSIFPPKLWPYRAITEMNTVYRRVNRKTKRQLESRAPLSTNRVIRLTVERFPNKARG